MNNRRTPPNRPQNLEELGDLLIECLARMEQMESDNAAIREALEGTGVLDKPSNLLTLQQAADAIGVSYRTAQRMVANDEMPGAVYVKRRWKVSRRKLERYYGLTD